MTFFEFKDLLITGLATVILGIIGYTVAELVNVLKSIRDSIAELNTQIAIVIAKTDNHERRIERLEEK